MLSVRSVTVAQQCKDESTGLGASYCRRPSTLKMLESLGIVIATHWYKLLPAFLLVWLARNYFHNGLQEYPGPFLASLTNWWRFFDVWGWTPQETQLRLHRKYGDVVRLGPKVLSFSNPAALPDIYGLNKGFVKVCSRNTTISNAC